MNVGGDTRQVDEPDEQNDGAVQVVVVVVVQEELVYRMLSPEQEYVGVQEQDAYWYVSEPESTPSVQVRV